jgi:hypothetical protein
MDYLQPFQALLKSRKFLLAVFAVAQSIVFGLQPEFPAEIWQAIDALVIALIAMIAVEDAAAKRAGS